MQNTAMSAKSLITLDLVTTVMQNIGTEYDGLLEVHTDCKVAHELLTAERLKSWQCALDGGSTMIKIVET